MTRTIAAVVIGAIALATIAFIASHTFWPRWQPVQGQLRLPDRPVECGAGPQPGQTEESYVARCGVQ